MVSPTTVLAVVGAFAAFLLMLYLEEFLHKGAAFLLFAGLFAYLVMSHPSSNALVTSTNVG